MITKNILEWVKLDLKITILTRESLRDNSEEFYESLYVRVQVGNRLWSRELFASEDVGNAMGEMSKEIVTDLRGEGIVVVESVLETLLLKLAMKPHGELSDKPLAR